MRARLEALSRYAILDTPPEQAFDDLCAIAARVCRAPIAVVNLVEETRQFFKAEIGLGVRETPVDVSICAHAILQRDLFVVPDTTRDPRFACNPLVQGAPHLRFYAGALIETPEGVPIGTVCVLDHQPRPDGLTDEQADTLRALARQAMTQLEHRRLMLRLAEREAELERVQDIAGVGGLEVDLRSGFKNRRSPQYLRIHGLPVDAADETHEEWVRRIHPDDRARTEGGFIAAVRKGETSYRAEYRIIRPSDGEVRWIAAVAEIERDEAGRPIRLVGAHRDITERKRDEEALRTSEQRLRAILDTMPQMVWSTRPNGDHDYFNKRWYEFTGVPEGTTDGEGWNGMFHPDDQERAWTAWRHSLATGEPYEIEYRLRHRSGDYRWVLGRALPVRDEAGAIERWYGTCTDINEQKTTAGVLAAQTGQLQALLATAPVAVWFTDDLQVRRVMRNGYAGGLMGVAETSTASLTTTGAGSITGIRMRYRGAPADPSELPLQRAVRGEDVRDEEYELVFEDGRPSLTLLSSASPLRDASGAVTGAVAVSLDITARKRTEEARELLARELSHRIKNIFAVVGGLVALSARGQPEAATFADNLRHRLHALAQAHEYVRPHSPESAPDVEGQSVRGLIELLLSPYAQGRADRIVVRGSDALLGSKSATALALCLHEQATNAMKYGALSAPAGRVEIVTQVTDGVLHLRWQEIGGPEVKGAPERQGFGTVLAARSIAGQLGGELRHNWRPSGLEMDLSVPLENLAR
ncbi:PAS domain-containing protein [Salinarimonas soli]|uniref:PAS domain-containing protein n=1 Tax=Salinarimonas soli TaxID=1638099 RepID=UPI003F672C54